MNCKYCNKEINHKGNFKQHEKSCEKIFLSKNEIIRLYTEEYYSINKICKIYNSGINTISNMLNNYIRTYSEANKIAHKKYPEKFKHTEETKQKCREKRLEWLKNNPDKITWIRRNTISYPEQMFLNKLIELEYNKRYYIIRERSFSIYSIDFAFEDYKLAIEIDGSQHLLPERKKSDDKKDALLIENEWSIIRFSVKEVNENINNCFKIIEEKLNNLNKIEVIRVGIIKETKKYIKKRDENGFSIAHYNASYNRRKVKDRPSLDDLIKDVNELGYTNTGKKYNNVKPAAIKSWLKQYLKIDDINSIVNEDSKIYKYHNGQLNKRKIEDRPSFEELKNDIYELDYNGTGKKYNVNKDTIKNWVRYYKENFEEYKNIIVEIKKNENGLTDKQLSRRKVERPSLKQLEKDVEELGYKETGKKYNVYRTTISYWIKQYKK